MSEQEMAEWLAEKVLEMKKSGEGLGWWNGPSFECTGDELIAVIDSPDGMDAVWDALDKRRGDGWSTIFKAYENGNFICTFEFRMNPICMGKGKTRREAFYNAVYQVRKENK